MSQGRNPTNDGSDSKGHEPRTTDGSPVDIDRLASNDEQTLIGFSAGGIHAALAISDPDLTIDEARQLANDVVDDIGGVA